MIAEFHCAVSALIDEVCSLHSPVLLREGNSLHARSLVLLCIFDDGSRDELCIIWMILCNKIGNLLELFRLLDSGSIVGLDLVLACEVLHCCCCCFNWRSGRFGGVYDGGLFGDWVVVDLDGDRLIGGIGC